MSTKCVPYPNEVLSSHEIAVDVYCCHCSDFYHLTSYDKRFGCLPLCLRLHMKVGNHGNLTDCRKNSKLLPTSSMQSIPDQREDQGDVMGRKMWLYRIHQPI